MLDCRKFAMKLNLLRGIAHSPLQFEWQMGAPQNDIFKQISSRYSNSQMCQRLAFLFPAQIYLFFHEKRNFLHRAKSSFFYGKISN
jgi:hypothetical protein